MCRRQLRQVGIVGRLHRAVVRATDGSQTGHARNRGNHPIVGHGCHFPNRIVRCIADEKVAMAVDSDTAGKIELGCTIDAVIRSHGSARQRGKGESLPVKRCPALIKALQTEWLFRWEMASLYTVLLAPKLQSKTSNRRGFSSYLRARRSQPWIAIETGAVRTRALLAGAKCFYIGMFYAKIRFTARAIRLRVC